MTLDSSLSTSKIFETMHNQKETELTLADFQWINKQIVAIIICTFDFCFTNIGTLANFVLVMNKLLLVTVYFYVFTADTIVPNVPLYWIFMRHHQE